LKIAVRWPCLSVTVLAPEATIRPLNRPGEADADPSACPSAHIHDQFASAQLLGDVDLADLDRPVGSNGDADRGGDQARPPRLRSLARWAGGLREVRQDTRAGAAQQRGQALHRYLRRRDRPASPVGERALLLSSSGKRLDIHDVEKTFAILRRLAAIQPRSGTCRPDSARPAPPHLRGAHAARRLPLGRGRQPEAGGALDLHGSYLRPDP
jgi:hypothetical protein